MSSELGRSHLFLLTLVFGGSLASPVIAQDCRFESKTVFSDVSDEPTIIYQPRSSSGGVCACSSVDSHYTELTFLISPLDACVPNAEEGLNADASPDPVAVATPAKEEACPVAIGACDAACNRVYSGLDRNRCRAALKKDILIQYLAILKAFEELGDFCFKQGLKFGQGLAFEQLNFLQLCLTYDRDKDGRPEAVGELFKSLRSLIGKYSKCIDNLEKLLALGEGFIKSKTCAELKEIALTILREAAARINEIIEPYLKKIGELPYTDADLKQCRSMFDVKDGELLNFLNSNRYASSSSSESSTVASSASSSPGIASDSSSSSSYLPVEGDSGSWTSSSDASSDASS